jgi:hypothetical protein
LTIIDNEKPKITSLKSKEQRRISETYKAEKKDSSQTKTRRRISDKKNSNQHSQLKLF